VYFGGLAYGSVLGGRTVKSRSRDGQHVPPPPGRGVS
jgi:hypothetical protein